ncbi:MAG: hypothetical protein F6K50_52050 [Moorea sp. SIO3I7]|nr:hypothetical protein [Moorena sp. SIO3I7]NEO63538.1 hypothetical protein [Moorena sp. SIO4G2]
MNSLATAHQLPTRIGNQRVGWVEVRNPKFMLALLGFTPCSLFPVPCSLFPVPCSLFPLLKYGRGNTIG